MRKITRDGLCLCEFQARVFEQSVEKTESSSEIFMRRFMKSGIAKQFDDGSILNSTMQPLSILDEVDAEYGPTTYGSAKYTKNEMYWIGYLCRYYAFTYEKSSSQVYRIVKPKELRGLYLPYHTLDPSQAIERILEAKGMLLSEEEELQRQYRIFRRIRGLSTEPDRKVSQGAGSAATGSALRY